MHTLPTKDGVASAQNMAVPVRALALARALTWRALVPMLPATHEVLTLAQALLPTPIQALGLGLGLG